VFQTALNFDTNLSLELIRADGSARGLGSMASGRLQKPLSYWHALWLKLRKELPFVAAMSFVAFLAWLAPKRTDGVGCAVVTNAGIQYLMTLFVSSSNPLINAKYHDCGIGTATAVVGDTVLGSAAGTARVAGSASNPSNPVYQSVATISFTTGLAITEWGLFTASSVGTLWDRKVFSAVNVLNGDSIAFTYTLTGTAG
jgi:hypothetical protein